MAGAITWQPYFRIDSSTQPDFVKLAESYSIRGYKIETQEELITVLPEVFAYDGPVWLIAVFFNRKKFFQ